MSERKHPTHVIYHHDPASLPAELHAALTQQVTGAVSSL